MYSIHAPAATRLSVTFTTMRLYKISGEQPYYFNMKSRSDAYDSSYYTIA